MKTNRSATTHPAAAVTVAHVEDRGTLTPAARRALRSPVIRPVRLRVRDLMTFEPAALMPYDDLATLYDLLDTRHVRHVPVVDEDGDLVGLVTHRDLLRCALAEENDLPLSLQRDMLVCRKVGEIMTPDPETVEAETEIGVAAQTMFENKYGCLPVVEGARLVGILTESDFVRYLAEAESVADRPR
jgi:CBS domain-containing membrane protein